MVGTRNVSVMFEVSEEVYDNIVTPFKKNKMLGKLMASLLTGYLEEEEIRSYVDTEIEGMHKASVDVVSSLFEGMQESLASMGIFTEEAKGTAERGKKYFKEKSESVPNVSSPEVNEMKQDISNIKEQMQEIKDLITNLSKQGVTVVPTSEVSEEAIREDVAENNTPTDEEKKVASSIISGMLTGNAVTF